MSCPERVKQQLNVNDGTLTPDERKLLAEQLSSMRMRRN